MVTTVVFDLDDTLYDEAEYCRSGFAAVAKYLARGKDAPAAGIIAAALWNQFAAGNRSKTFNAALDELGLDYDQNRVAELVGVYRNHVPSISLARDSEEVLAKLKAKYTLGLLTDGFLPAQQLKVEALGIEKYFASIVYTEQLGRECWKPSPAGFEKILRDLGARPENAVYVADNKEKDFIAPNGLGMVTIQLLRSVRVHVSGCVKPGAAAQHVVRQISGLPALIDSL